MASKSATDAPAAGHLYRYRTTALIGPWRKTARRAVLDAVHAHQARRDERNRERVRWLVPGRIEEIEAN